MVISADREIERSNCLSQKTFAVPKNNKARRTEVLRAKLGLELATLSFPCTCVGRLAFAGRKFPDTTLRDKRRFRSHGGTATAVSG